MQSNRTALVSDLRKNARSLVREFGFFQTHYAGTEATHGESHALIELNRLGPLEVGELARILNMEKTSTSKMLSQMEKKKWVQLMGAADRRKRVYELTKEGARITKGIERTASTRMEEALRELKNESYEAVRSSLAALAEALRVSRARKQFTVRPCTKKDDKSIASIVRRSLKDFGFAGPGTAAVDKTLDHLSSFNTSNSCYLVADEGGRIMGGAGIAPMEGESKNVCELIRMFLHPEARSSGISQLLLDSVLEKAQKLGFEICYLETTKEMQAAQRLYRKNGFTYVEKRRGNTGHFACNVLMEKRLK